MRNALLAVAICLASISTVSAWALLDSGTGHVIDERWRSGVPLGGIGCGAVELLTDGGFGNVTANHNWDRPTGVLQGSFAAVRCASPDGPVGRVLRLSPPGEYRGLSNIAHTRYLGMYPRAEVDFRDDGLPVLVRMHAHSPLIPRNVRDSALPVAFLDFTLTNPGQKAVDVAVALSWENLVGFGGRDGNAWDFTEGQVQSEFAAGKWSGVAFTSTETFEDMRQNVIGTHFAGAQEDDGVQVSTCTKWDTAATSVPWWPGFVESGRVESAPAVGVRGRPAGVVAARTTLAPGETRPLHFVIAWHMPTFRMEHKRTGYTDKLVVQETGGAPAIDGDLATRWGTGREKRAGDEFTLDLGEGRPVTGIVLDSSPSSNDLPRGCRIDLSQDGSKWHSAATVSARDCEAGRESGVLSVEFPERRARFVRITNLENETFWWWSIHELSVLGSDGEIDLTGASTRQRVVASESTVVKSDVGHYHMNYFEDITGILEYAGSERARLLAQTREWQDLILQADLPFWLKLKLINCVYTMYSTTVLTKDGRFAVLESPVDMRGALGTMDQRMASHGFYVQMFPSLDESELRLFAQCQQDDGRITHFNGNVHEVIGDPRIGYGITDWPDLSCSWIMQVLKLYRWTGDRELLDDMWPRVQRVIEWLQAADEDGDLIPEGGSTYDYEQLPRGAFIYSASCYLGALLAAEEMAKVQGDGGLAAEYRARFLALRQAVMKRLWNGEYFMKWRAADGKTENPNSFVAALAGDWLARLCGLPDTLAPSIVDAQTTQLIARHLKPFFPVPPMEVTRSGKVATSACFLLQHEPYLGCESIYRGFVADGLEVLRRVYHCAWEQNKSPWDQSLAYGAPGGGQGGLRSYMTCPTTWHVLNALTGASLDAPSGTLYLSPRLMPESGELHCPVFLGTFWAWVDYVPEQGSLRIKVLKTFDDCDVKITQIARDGNHLPSGLAAPFKVEAGRTLDLSDYRDTLAPYKVSRQVAWSAGPSSDIYPGLVPDEWSARVNVPDARPSGDTDPARAFDRQIDTRWSTNRGMRPGDWFEVDLGEERSIGGIWASVEGSKQDYPRGYEVLVSPDGQRWTKVAAADEGTSRRSVRHEIWRCEFDPVIARYVRIVQNGRADKWWWSIHELYILPEGFTQEPPIGKPLSSRSR